MKTIYVTFLQRLRRSCLTLEVHCKSLSAVAGRRVFKAESVAIQGTTKGLGKGIARYGRRLRVVGAAGVVTLVLAACASLGGTTANSPPEVKQAAVTEQVKARWQALIAGDVSGSYSFLTAASRKVLSLDAYKARARLSGFRAADIESVACDAEMCKVKVIVTYDHRLMKGIKAPIEESWVLENGRYWYVWPL
jgi:hypothetical protein